MQDKLRSRTTLVVVAALAIAAVAGTAAALVSDTTIQDESTGRDVFRGVTVNGSALEKSLIQKATIEDSLIEKAKIQKATIRESYLHEVLVEEAALHDTRVDAATLRSVSFTDLTACQTGGAIKAGEQCVLASTGPDGIEVHAMLLQDAPESAAPGETIELRLAPHGADELVVGNDAVGATELGFDPSAPDESVASIEMIVDGETVETFGLGERVELPDESEITLRVHLAETGIVDTSTLGLVLSLDGHDLRTGLTTLDVVATQLAFAPAEAQPFAPFLADSVGRLLVSLPTDEHGNVDRDIDVSVTRDVQNVEDREATDTEHVGDIDHHVAVHGDSELFSANPVGYAQPTSEAAHHPATLESILRDTVGLPDIEFGSVGFHATHIVAIGPTETTAHYHGEAMNAEGEVLEADTTLVMPPANEEETTVSLFGGEFDIPGEGMLLVRFVDDEGQPVESGDGWELVITETPDSHNITKRVAIDGDSEREPLPGTALVPLPFGNFIPSEFRVCVEHDGETDCANDGDLIVIETGETKTVDIDVS